MSGTVLARMESSVEGSKKLNVEVISDRQMFNRVAVEWDQLLEKSGNTNLYLSHDWLYTWWLWFGEKTPHQLSILCVYRDGLLIAIAPFYIEHKISNRMSNKKTLRLLGQVDVDINIPECEQLDIISAGNHNDRNQIITALNNQLKGLGGFSHLIFKSIAKNSLLYQLINQYPHSQTSGFKKATQALSLSLPASLDDYISAQNKGWRIRYRGDKKKMDVLGKADFRSYTQPHEIHAGLQSLMQLLCSQQRKISGGKCSFDAEQFMKFHEDICHLFSLKDRVEIVSLVMGGRLLASVCYYKTDDHKVQVYQMASVRGEGIRFSPLDLLITHVIEQLIEQGCLQMDFLSNCNCSDLGEGFINGNSTSLYTLGWHKNWGRAYFYKSAKKLYRALQVN